MRRERRFFKELLDDNGVETVLDCFCGTGFHLAMLAGMGYAVEGIDISTEMIEKARQNLNERGVKAPVWKCDVKELISYVDQKYDCVISMGNSLPHEFGDENLSKALGNMHEALNDDGICIVHLENYDLLYQDSDRFIPSTYRRHEQGAEAFIFAIDYFEDKVVFNILSVIERGGRPQFNVDVVEYNPLWVDKLKRLMSHAGFRDLRLYEDFSMTPLGKNHTYDVIAVAKK